MSDEQPLSASDAAFSKDLTEFEQPDVEHIRRGFALAVLGVIPWVGGFLASAASAKSALDQSQIDLLQRQWLEEHARKIQELTATLDEMLNRLLSFGEETKKRLESPEFLQLIRSGFRQWDQADSQERKKLIVTLLTNAGATRITSDDIVRLFLDWIDAYHEIHFAVIRTIYKQNGITRREIWQNVHGTHVREVSAEADLFKLLIRSLSTGGVIRQHRETDYAGNYIPKKRAKATPGGKGFTSAFDDEEEYELTALGRQFVHYTMNEVVPRIN
jgi:hypothetical protein